MFPNPSVEALKENQQQATIQKEILNRLTSLHGNASPSRTKMSDLCTSSNNMRINSHPITVDFDGAQKTLIG